MTTPARVVLCTVPSEDVGVTIARQLVDEQLVACVNIVPGVRSIYRYQGKVEDDRELLLVMKTADDRLTALIPRVRELHPYEVCEVLVLDVSAGSQPYLDWILAETR
ncbi:MAG TPA: divalent-cation tolerance protein CutA [Polyangiales bacterium]